VRPAVQPDVISNSSSRPASSSDDDGGNQPQMLTNASSSFSSTTTSSDDTDCGEQPQAQKPHSEAVGLQHLRQAHVLGWWDGRVCRQVWCPPRRDPLPDPLLLLPQEPSQESHPKRAAQALALCQARAVVINATMLFCLDVSMFATAQL